jgi:DNA-directed RNA polymerase specialized sigma24 family protein
MLPRLLQDVYVEAMDSDVPCSEVAAQMGLSKAAAKSRMFRARKRVEHALEPVTQRKAA